MDFFSEEAQTAGQNKRSTSTIQFISARKLVASEDNFYSTEDVADLMQSIGMLGVLQNLVVVKIPGADKYIIKAGHRRHKAVMALLDEGRNDLEMVPCNVISLDNAALEKLVLISTNATARELSAYEKMEQAQQAKLALEQLQAQGYQLKGRSRDYIAEMLKTSAAQVARMEAIGHNLTAPLKEQFKAGAINASTAYELSGLPEEKQQQAAAQVEQGKRVDIKAAKALKAETKPAPVVGIDTANGQDCTAYATPPLLAVAKEETPAGNQLAKTMHAIANERRDAEQRNSATGIIGRLRAAADAISAGNAVDDDELVDMCRRSATLIESMPTMGDAE